MAATTSKDEKIMGLSTAALVLKRRMKVQPPGAAAAPPPPPAHSSPARSIRGRPDTGLAPSILDCPDTVFEVILENVELADAARLAGANPRFRAPVNAHIEKKVEEMRREMVELRKPWKADFSMGASDAFAALEGAWDGAAGRGGMPLPESPVWGTEGDLLASMMRKDEPRPDVSVIFAANWGAAKELFMLEDLLKPKPKPAEPEIAAVPEIVDDRTVEEHLAAQREHLRTVFVALIKKAGASDVNPHRSLLQALMDKVRLP
jgi:hypothetical protein